MSPGKEPESQVRTRGSDAEAGKVRAGGARTPAGHPGGRPGIAAQIPGLPAAPLGAAVWCGQPTESLPARGKGQDQGQWSTLALSGVTFVVFRRPGSWFSPAFACDLTNMVEA